MRNPNLPTLRTHTEPLAVPRTQRSHMIRTLTSLPAGKIVPIVASPMLREDAVSSGAIRLNFEMMETAELLMNAVNVRVCAHLVPWLAFDRFASLDEFNKSYEGLPYRSGDAVIPFFETEVMPAHGTSEFYTYLGLHAQPGDDVNTGYLESYNQIVNFRRKNRSPDLTLRALDDDTLAEAFWSHDAMRHIVPDFDQAKIDGEIPVSLVNSLMPIRGIGSGTGSDGTYKESDGTTGTYTDGLVSPNWTTYGAATNNKLKIEMADATTPAIFAELAADGIAISLSNIDLAKKTRAFANLREKYNQLPEEFLIDLMMDGISVPEQMWRQPMLLADKTTVFGMSKRYATDAGNLAESAVNGATFIDLRIRTPRVPVGGIIMVTAEITPEQLYERQEDVFFHLSTVDELPQFLRDELDPEKVDVVQNSYVDTDHATPDATFGYAPLNFKWHMKAPRIGGKFYRPEVDASFDEDRQRLWAVEKANPVLSEDFYICTTIHQKPFADTVSDPFEVVATGMINYTGNTVFGPKLIEATDDYEQVEAEAPTTRIDKTA